MGEHDPWALVSRPGPLLLYDTRRMPSWGGGGGGEVVEGGSVRHHRHPALSHHYLLGNCSCHLVTGFFCLLGVFFSSFGSPPKNRVFLKKIRLSPPEGPQVLLLSLRTQAARESREGQMKRCHAQGADQKQAPKINSDDIRNRVLTLSSSPL